MYTDNRDAQHLNEILQNIAATVSPSFLSCPISLRCWPARLSLTSRYRSCRLAVTGRWCIVGGMTVKIADTRAEDIRKRTLLDALYRKYSAALRTFLVRHHVRRDDVADIVQETYCRVLKAGELEAIRDPKAFLFRVASNVVLNAAKHRRSEVEDPAVDIDILETDGEKPSLYRELEAEQELAIVRAALEELAPRCREVFVLHRF